MSQLPLRTSVSAAYPNPSNATARVGFGVLWDVLFETTQSPEIDLASAATCEIGGQTSRKLRITGTVGITSFGTTYTGPILLRMASAVIITHNATSLQCPGGASITTGAGDAFMAWPVSSVSGTPDGWRLVRLDGIVPIALGGTGSPTAAGGFTAIKQAASTTATGVVELLTTAELQTGTDATRAPTAAAIFAALGYSKYVVTAQQTITLGGLLTIAHGIGRVPVEYDVYLVNVSGEGGFVPGQESNVTGTGASSVGLVVDSLNIYVRYGTSAPVITRTDTGAALSITPASWRAVFKIKG